MQKIPPAVTEEEINAHIMGLVLVEHYNMKKGLELFVESCEKAVTKELSKIHDMSTYEPMYASKLSYQEKQYALAYMLFITEKSNCDMKSRKVEIGSKQCTYYGYNKSNNYSPTVNTDSEFLTEVVYAHERRSV